MLMLPVSIGLGLINLNLLPEHGDRLHGLRRGAARDRAAFRIYMLPQGMFSVAVATVLFPQLARLAARADYAGMRGDDRHRPAADRAAADPRRRGDARAVGADGAARLRARGVRRRVDAADRRGAVLVRVQPAVLRLRADAHARVLLAPAPVGPDHAGRRLAGGQRGRLLPAEQAVRDRRHRARHDRVQRRAGDRRGGAAAARAAAASRPTGRSTRSRR